MERKKNILKEADVLLIAAVMVLSTIAVTADTNYDAPLVKISLISSTVNKQVNSHTYGENVIWDNGMNYVNSLAAQYDPNHPLDAYPADDFHFEEDTEVGDVHWIGAYFNGDPEPFDWCISFMNDDGTGNAPDSHPQDPSYAGPFCYTWEEINKVDLGNGYFEMSVDLPEDITFPGCYKFWISIWGEGAVFPQSMWGCHYQPILLRQAVFRSDYFGYPFWTDTEVVFGTSYDMCFQLTSKCKPAIRVEKCVWDPDNEKWVDADTANEALDLKICTDAKFKINITNNGTCCDLYHVNLFDEMDDSLRYISADPEPTTVNYRPPCWHIHWLDLGSLSPGQSIEINITAHVEGPNCSIDKNWAQVDGHTDCVPPIVADQDFAFVHAIKKSRELNTLFLKLLEKYLQMFPILQLLLQ